MDHIDLYGHTVVALVIYAVMLLILNAMTGIAKGNLNMAPGEHHAPDYANKAYRLDRAYMNSVEMVPAFAVLAILSILVGGNPLLVNILASVTLLSRITANVLMIRGIGAGYGGPRTVVIVAGVVCQLGLGLIVVKQVFLG